MGNTEDIANWELRVKAAYHRFCGDTQPETAQKVSRSERTIRRWESEPSWGDAKREAANLWLDDLEREARSTLLSAVSGGDPVRAMQVVERLDEALSPAAQKLEHSGEVDTGGETHIYLPDNDRDQVPEAIRQRQESLKNGDKR